MPEFMMPDCAFDLPGYDDESILFNVMSEDIRLTVEELSLRIGTVTGSKWIRSGRPYFKVWPIMCQLIQNTKIDIPAKWMRFPFDVFCVLVPKGTFIREDGNEVTSIIIYKIDDRKLLKEKKGEDYVVISFLMFMKDSFIGRMFALPEEYSVENALKATVKNMEIEGGGKEELEGMKFTNEMMRMAFAAALFGSDQQDLILPDFPRKLEERYLRAKSSCDRKALAEIWKKAQRNGPFKGYKLGSEIDLPTPYVKYVGKPDKEGNRELEFGHLRRSFSRWQWVGSGNEKRQELRIVKSTVVRPDLPMKPMQGYRIRGTELDSRDKQR